MQSRKCRHGSWNIETVNSRSRSQAMMRLAFQPSRPCLCSIAGCTIGTMWTVCSGPSGPFVSWCPMLSKSSSPSGGRSCKAEGRASTEKTAFYRPLAVPASACHSVGAGSASEAFSFREAPDRRDHVRRPSEEHRLRPQSSGSVCDFRGGLTRVDHVWLGHRWRGE